MATKKDIKTKPMKPNSTYQVFNSMLQFEKVENQKQKHFWVMGANDQNVVLCAYLVGVGERNIRDYSISDILAIAIKSEATKIVIAHNYPNSKNHKPTENDIDGTSWLYQATQILGITLEDHIIIFNKA